MSSDDGFDLNQEPKKVFVNFLIYNMKQIEDQLFFGGRDRLAVQGIRGLICSLDQKSQKKLEPQLKKLREWDGGKSYYKSDVETIYQQVCTYLHQNYLREEYFAKPRYDAPKTRAGTKQEVESPSMRQE